LYGGIRLSLTAPTPGGCEVKYSQFISALV
jgi:hypothetical protein